jgi:hypothetical protein
MQQLYRNGESALKPRWLDRAYGVAEATPFQNLGYFSTLGSHGEVRLQKKTAAS